MSGNDHGESKPPEAAAPVPDAKPPEAPPEAPSDSRAERAFQPDTATAPGIGPEQIKALLAAAPPDGGKKPSDKPPPAIPDQDVTQELPAFQGEEAAVPGRPTTPVPAISRFDPDEPEGIRLRLYGQTDVGLVREHNEDNFLIADLGTQRRGVEGLEVLKVQAAGSIVAVCDGMGGAAAGEVASQMAVDTVYEVMQHGGPPKDRDSFARRLVRSIEEAGSRIFTAAKLDRTRRGMGTTSTVAGVVDKVLFVGQVGDSRAYVLRGDQLNQVTKDQSLVEQLIEAGQLSPEEAEAFEHSNIILQALGTAENVQVDLTFLELRKGDRLLLCSDGLSGLVHAELMREVLRTTAEPKDCCARLIEMARNGGGHDNITVIVVDFDGKELPPAAAGERGAYQQYPLPPSTDDPRETLPPRDANVKTGGPKPGADVKWQEGQGANAAGGESKSGLFLIAVLLAFGVIIAIGVLIFASLRDVPADEGVGSPQPVSELARPASPPSPPAPVAAARVDVRVQTDVEGAELFVDGERRAAISPNSDAVLQLTPGAYRFEARRAGSVVATRLVTVREGFENDVLLNLPQGAGDVPEGAPTPEQAPSAPPSEMPAWMREAPPVRHPR